MKLIAEGKMPKNTYPLPEVIQLIENSSKPVIAAIHGTALGGGLEIALGCHYRIALASAKCGLPEVQLGLLPGAGGTQRLPRLVGPQVAIQMISTGAPASASAAMKTGILDHVLPAEAKTRNDLLKAAVIYAKATSCNGIPLEMRRTSLKHLPPIPDTAFDGAKAMANKAARGFLAPQLCIDAVQAAFTSKSFAEGMRVESKLFFKLMTGDQSKAQLHFFGAQRAAAKIPGVPAGSATKFRKCGIIGAGTMGGGIAMCFIEVGIDVVLIDAKQEYVDNGLKIIRGNYASSIKRKKLSEKQAEAYMNRIKPSIDYNDLKDVDIVIEAVFENMQVKKEVFGKLDKVCKRECLLCSNTSTLDIDEIAASTRRPESVLGAHFFSPANKMRLLEIVRGKRTANSAIADLLALGKKIKKVSVVAGNCFGFIGNRVFNHYGAESLLMIEEGATLEQVDKVMYDFGFPMGPFTVGDVVGTDVSYKIRESRGLTDPKNRDPNERYLGELGDKLYRMKRFGIKTKKGWYDYEGRKPVASPEVQAMINQYRTQQRITPRKFEKQEILERCLYPLINDCFNILEEGIALRPSDIDVVLILGYGFPLYRWPNVLC